jgi:hypothetical protein
MKTVTAAVAVKIVSALVDPAGTDTGKETITIRNNAPAAVDLAGWSFEVKGKTMPLAGTLSAAGSKTFTLDGTNIKLANTGGTINLLNAQKQIADTAVYTKSQVKPGVLIEF